MLPESLELFSSVGLEIYLQDEPVRCSGRIVWVLDKKDVSSSAPLLFDTGIEFYPIDAPGQQRIDDFVQKIINEA